MFHRAPLGSPARNRFLEDARESLLESLDRAQVIEAIGETTVQRLRDINDLLYVPTINEYEEVATPFHFNSSERIPIVALKQGEAVHVDRNMTLPTPRQTRVISRFLDTLVNSAETTNQIAETEVELIKAMRRTIPSRGVDLSLDPGSFGHVKSSGALIDGNGIGLGHSPGFFVLRGRPRVALAYRGGYPRTVVLSHELIHVEQDLAAVITPYNEASLMRQSYRHELEAYHYSALYINGLHSTTNPIKWLWAQTEIPQYERVEKIRQKYADPEDPFEPNEQIVEELRKIGIVWRPWGEYVDPSPANTQTS